MIEMQLKEHKSSQCHVEIDTKTREITFVSYCTPVVSAMLGEGKYYVQGHDASAYNQSWNTNRVREDAPYSATTGKQISWFLAEYFPEVTLKDMKSSAKNGELYTAHLKKDLSGIF